MSPGLGLRPRPPPLLHCATHPLPAAYHRSLSGTAHLSGARAGRVGVVQSEVKEERRAEPGSGDTSVARHPLGPMPHQASTRKRCHPCGARWSTEMAALPGNAFAIEGSSPTTAEVRAGRGQRVGGSVHVPRPRPAAEPSSFTSLRHPPTARGLPPLVARDRTPERYPSGSSGCRAERGKGGETGGARLGGHERCTAPARPAPAPVPRMYTSRLEQPR